MDIFLGISQLNACAYYGIPGTGSLIKLLNCSHRISSAFGWALKRLHSLQPYCQNNQTSLGNIWITFDLFHSF